MSPDPEMSTGNVELDAKIEEWLSWDKNEKTRSEIASLAKSHSQDVLEKLLLSRLQFGTAGLRGKMGTGYTQMNDLVIIQTTQGLAAYLLKVQPNVKSTGVVIGYDNRHNSRRWAELATSVFVSKDIPVYMYSAICPTPFVPFTVSHYQCAAGIMITASHNPKEDNGYKVYWSNGAQIIPPHDKGIQKHILENLCPWTTSWDTGYLEKCALRKDPLLEIMESYFDAMKKSVLFPNINIKTPVKITYTPMHGVGYKYIVEAAKAASFKPFIVVEEQKEPDPEFTTVKFPNPEEGRSSLDLSIRTANQNNCGIILANDPDADRLAVAEKHSGGEWRVFTGNELGSLLGWWALFSHFESNPTANRSDLYMIASTVSSKLLKRMAECEGFNFEETLTGFKWMGNRACELIAQGKTVLFAFEEAIGFMIGTAVLDKDGISAAAKVAEMAAYLETKKLSLAEKLEDIYKTYGYHISDNSYYLCYDQAVIKKMFERLRNFKGEPNTYPDSILDGKYKIIAVRDLTTGYDSTTSDKRALLPSSLSSQMLTFTFDNGLVATLRTSGTEPKIKYYTELCASQGVMDVSSLRKILCEMVEAIVTEFMQPKENNLTPRST